MSTKIRLHVYNFIVISKIIPVATIWSGSTWKDTSAKYCTCEQNNVFMENKAHKHDSCDKEITSVHSDQIRDVHNVPIDVLIRPIPSILDESKVQSLMETLQVCNLKQFSSYLLKDQVAPIWYFCLQKLAFRPFSVLIFILHNRFSLIT